MSAVYQKNNLEHIAILIGCMDQDGPVHGVGDLARFSHFKTTFWGNH